MKGRKGHQRDAPASRLLSTCHTQSGLRFSFFHLPRATRAYRLFRETPPVPWRFSHLTHAKTTTLFAPPERRAMADTLRGLAVPTGAGRHPPASWIQRNFESRRFLHPERHLDSADLHRSGQRSRFSAMPVWRIVSNMWHHKEATPDPWRRPDRRLIPDVCASLPDAVKAGVVAMDDAAVIKTIQDPSATPGRGGPGCHATHVSVTRVHTAGSLPGRFAAPNRQVDLNNVVAIILGVRGDEFSGPAIDLFPVRKNGDRGPMDLSSCLGNRQEGPVLSGRENRPGRSPRFEHSEHSNAVSSSSGTSFLPLCLYRVTHW